METATIDGRSYKEVVQKPYSMKLSKVVENDSWISHTLVGKAYNERILHEIKDRLTRDKIYGIALSTFDNEHFIINKVHNRRITLITDDERQKLSSIFQSLNLCHEKVKTKRDVYIEVIGVPLHQNGHKNLRSIGEIVGEVSSVLYIPTSFHSVALKVKMEVDKPIPQTVYVCSCPVKFEVAIR